jgi:hypothetical protein
MIEGVPAMENRFQSQHNTIQYKNLGLTVSMFLEHRSRSEISSTVYICTRDSFKLSPVLLCNENLRVETHNTQWVQFLTRQNVQFENFCRHRQP